MSGPGFSHDPAAVTAANPTGVVLSPDMKDSLERTGYWSNAIRYGLDYYVAGRFATASGFMPVSANILHHAVEMFLKACLAKDDSIELIRAYGHRNSYGHDLNLLWQAFKLRQRAAPAPEFDAVVEGLHAFEDIRYPERLISTGAVITIGIADTNDPPPAADPTGLKRYSLKLPQIDRLMALLLEASDANLPAFSPIRTEEQALERYEAVRTTIFGRTAASGNTSR